MVSRRKNPKSPSLAPPFKITRTRMQGKSVIKVSIEKDGIKVSKIQEKEPPPEGSEDGFGFTRTRVFDSWES